MNCQEIETYLYDFAEGKMITENMYLINEHIESCMNCRNKVNYLKAIHGEMEIEKQMKPSSDLTEKINAQIARSKKSETIKLASNKLWLKIAAALIVGIGLVSGVMVGNKTYYVDNTSHVTMNEQFGFDNGSYSLENLFFDENSNEYQEEP